MKYTYVRTSFLLVLIFFLSTFGQHLSVDNELSPSEFTKMIMSDVLYLKEFFWRPYFLSSSDFLMAFPQFETLNAIIFRKIERRMAGHPFDAATYSATFSSVVKEVIQNILRVAKTYNVSLDTDSIHEPIVPSHSTSHAMLKGFGCGICGFFGGRCLWQSPTTSFVHMSCYKKIKPALRKTNAFLKRVFGTPPKKSLQDLCNDIGCVEKFDTVGDFYGAHRFFVGAVQKACFPDTILEHYNNHGIESLRKIFNSAGIGALHYYCKRKRSFVICRRRS